MFPPRITIPCNFKKLLSLKSGALGEEAEREVLDLFVN